MKSLPLICYALAVSKATKIFLIILPFIVLIAVGVLNISLKTFKLAKEDSSGCGCDFKTAIGEFDPDGKTAFFMEKEILPPLAALSPYVIPPVLGEASPGEKWIEIDLSEQKLIAWEGGSKFLESLVSSGKWGRTPTGEFNIWAKYKYTKMSGGSKELHTYYYLPNVPYTMYFFKGFGLHGTYWHNNFGHTMSHGCVNLPTLVAEKLFYWTTPSLLEGKNSVLASKDNVGTRVVIHE